MTARRNRANIQVAPALNDVPETLVVDAYPLTGDIALVRGYLVKGISVSSFCIVVTKIEICCV